ncbi:MAG: proline hydroxylase [Euryarchaeota archaeon]|nr:proline hydroxylase [Euryarchaeota archaeon]
MMTASLTDEWFKQTAIRFHDLREQYANEDPFEHVVLNDFWPKDFAEDLADALAEKPTNTDSWHHFVNRRERKRATKPGKALVGQPGIVREALSALNDDRFVAALADVSATRDLVADPEYVGGGVHRIERGGMLAVHVDFNRHPTTRLFRRLNLLIYMNRDWKEEWNGELELWARDRSRLVKRVFPHENVAVLFDTARDSWHGHPTPLACPPSRARVSLATYYYAPEAGSQRRRQHSTRFLEDER